MDLVDIICLILELLPDPEVLRFWRFLPCLAAALALAGLLDYLTGGHVPGALLYIPLGSLGVLLGIL